MDPTLYELPFFPEESTLSQLPFFFEDRIDGCTLPSKPPSVCQGCWEGIFAVQLGLPLVFPRNGRWYHRWPEEISYSTSFTQLKSRAYAGCVWCRFVLREGRGYDPGKARGYDPDVRMIITVRCTLEKGGEGSDQIQNYQSLEVAINGRDEFKGFVYTALDDPAKPYFTIQNPILDVGSPRALALARQCIDECARGHGNCIAISDFPDGSPLLPKRLVDCTDLTRPRLVTPTEEHAGYLALSYVWGEDQIHKTTKSNVSTYEHGIAPSLLPPTIRDAIRVTHTLGFRWLWVDSLCILQDSDEDKLHEIGRMHHIYRHAHLTIVAASAEKASEGFLHRRTPPDDDVALPFICPPRPPNSQLGYVDSRSEVAQSQVGQIYLSSCLWAKRSYRDELGRMATRAWCMQEYLLSPRSLIFTPRTILFRCRTARQCVGHSPRGIKDDPQLPDALFLPVPPAAEPRSKQWEDAHDGWMEIVKNYSRRTASDESDKLVACAAIAEQFSSVLRCDYLAGLWRSDALLADLLWAAEVHSGWGRRHTRPTTYRAPSWSWAAIEGAVEQPLYKMDDVKNQTVALAEIVECWVTLENAALPYGRVMDGTLVLRGTPIPCHGGLGHKVDHDWGMPLPSFEQARCRKWGLGSLTSGEEDEIDFAKPKGSDRVLITTDCDADSELPGRMWVVPCVRWTDSSGNLWVHGIVLELALPSNSSKAEHTKIRFRFRRVGYFYDVVHPVETDTDFVGDQLWYPLIRAVKDGECPTEDIEIV